ncbi:MAG: QueT transporter family protein [Firmicutes bacterium]|nr:QueT transporter family protein [Bacillota bacterium]
MRFKPTQIALVIIGAVLYGLACFATMGIAIGFITLRPAAFIACAWGIFFGPWVGGLAAAIGNTFISDVLSGWFGIGGVGGFVGNFMMGFLPALLVKNVHNWKQISLWSGLSAVVCAFFIAGWMSLMKFAPFWVLFATVCASNIPVNVICTPIAVKYLINRVQKRGLYWREAEEM